MNRERADFPESDFPESEMERTRKELEDRADQVADYVRDTAEDFSSRVKERSGEAAGQAAEKFDRGRRSTAGALDRAAFKLHSRAESVPGGGRATTVTHRIADGMENAASYLRGHDVRDMRADIAALMRRHPAPTLASALTLGFLVGRALRR